MRPSRTVTRELAIANGQRDADRLLVLGPDRQGQMLELVAVPADQPARSCTPIGAALDTTRQAAQQRFGDD
jgi:hypothetical protein